MSENNQMYGFQEDNVPVSGGFSNFGLNNKAAKLVKFEWIPNGGKDGAEQEALEIKFLVGEKEFSYRRFPITSAFDKDGNKVTDMAAPEIQEEAKNFSAVVTHILHCFVDMETIKAAFSRPIASFKEFCQIAMSVLPQGYQDRWLDIFFHYQYSIRKDAKITFLELPQNMKQGKWLCPAQNYAPGVKWEERKIPGATNGQTALEYVSVDANGVPVTVVEPNVGAKEKIHPFTRTGWFMNSNYANQQKVEGAATPGSPSAPSAPAAPVAPPTAPGTDTGW